MSISRMRILQVAALAVSAFAATTFKTTDANAVIYCVEGAYRAGCVARPVVAPSARGVARRTTRRVVRRRSDVNLKHDISLIGHLDNGLGFYRFSYNGSDKAYVGVIAQEVQTVVPQAVVRSRDGYWNVLYDKLGLKFQTYDHWVASGGRIPSSARVRY